MKTSFVLAKTILMNSAGQVLLLQRSPNDPTRALEWDLPGGRVDAGEDMTEAAVRETAEEAGIVIAPERLSLAYAMTEVTEHGNTSWLFFTGLTEAAEVALSHEHVAYEWVTLDKALEMIEYKRQHKALQHIFDNNLFD